MIRSFAQRARSLIHFTLEAVKRTRYTPQSDFQFGSMLDFNFSRPVAVALTRCCLERLAFAPRLAPDFRVKSDHQKKIL